MPIMVNRISKQNFTGNVLSQNVLIQDLKAVEKSKNISLAAIELTAKAQGDLSGIRDAIETYFPQSRKLKKLFGISHKAQSHPRRSI